MRISDARIALLSSLLAHLLVAVLVFYSAQAMVHLKVSGDTAEQALAIHLVSDPEPLNETTSPTMEHVPLERAQAKQVVDVEPEVNKISKTRAKEAASPAIRKSSSALKKQFDALPNSVISGEEAQARESFASQIIALIGKEKRYPLRAQRLGLEDSVSVKIRVLRTGELASLALTSTSKYAMFDTEVLRMVKAAAPFPSAPPAMGQPSLEIEIPVQFQLR